MKKMKIGLISHLIRDNNLGCSALAVSNIRLMDEVFEKNNIEVEYVIILANPKEKIDLKKYTSLKGFTKNAYSYRTYPRLKPILKNPFLLKKTKAFNDCDYVIDLCGGDGYTDNYGIIRLLAESVPVFGCKDKKVPCIFAPQTIGPFNTWIGKKVAYHTLKKLNTIFVRDKSSYKCCEELGLKNITSQVIDVAFALPFKKIKLDNNKINIGINVSGLLYNGGYNHDNYFKLKFSYKDFIDELISILQKDENVQLHLIPHVIYDTEGVDDDYSVCSSISEKYSNVKLAPKFESAMEAKSYISSMDLFSGARMHSTIGATSSGVPVIPIAYSRKFNGLFDTLNYPYYIDAKADITIDEAINKFMHYKDNIRELKAGIEQAKEIYIDKIEKYKLNLEKVLEL